MTHVGISPEARLEELGIELPDPPTLPFVARLKPVVVHGGLAYLSGNGDLGCLGRVGDDIDVERAANAARMTAHLMCRSLRDELGSLDQVERWLKVLVLVRSAPGFGDEPAVANGFSNAIADLWARIAAYAPAVRSASPSCLTASPSRSRRSSRSPADRPSGRTTPGRDSSMKEAASASGSENSIVDQLRALGVKRGVLVQMAERGQLLALRCEMPQCYHHKGPGAFDPITTPRTKWAPSPDHYPILKSAGGKLVPENVRLAHVWCNNRDYGWRTTIRTMLAKGKSLVEIAEALNKKGVPPAHGRDRWTAAMVREAYVS